jgi:hypothetical protein
VLYNPIDEENGHIQMTNGHNIFLQNENYQYPLIESSF